MRYYVLKLIPICKSSLFISITVSVYMKCLNCQEKLNGKYQLKFCNRSCSAIYNNKKYPKRKKNTKSYPKCKLCDNPTKRKSGVYCEKCITKRKHYRGFPLGKQTIEECCKRKGSNRYDIIRDNTRRLYKNNLKNPICEFCGYSKHVEICHRKPISSFPKETLVSVVNDKENILFLCPNCHWEFDHSN